MQPDSDPHDSLQDTAVHARAATSLRMLGLAPGVIIGVLVGIRFDNILVGIGVGVVLAVSSASFIEWVTSRKTGGPV